MHGGPVLTTKPPCPCPLGVCKFTAQIGLNVILNTVYSPIMVLSSGKLIICARLAENEKKA